LISWIVIIAKKVRGRGNLLKIIKVEELTQRGLLWYYTISIDFNKEKSNE
jgi:hypothetical protein